MKFFLKNIKNKILYFLFIFTLFIFGTISLNYDHKTDYPAAIKGKYERLDSLRNTQKIIIAGGSSSSYSIDSELLQQTFKKPVINTSLAMSLGSKFHLNLTKDYLKKGDVVLYIPEYEFYYGNEFGDDFLYTTAFYYPQIIKDFTIKQKLKGVKKTIKLPIDFFIGYVKKKFQKKEKSSQQYHRSSYNYLGDNISLIYVDISKIKEDKKSRYQKLKSKNISSNFLSFLKEMNAICIEKGVTLLITYPPIETSQFDNRFFKDIDKIKKESGITFFGNPNEYVYDVDLFYDSSYHLNGKGRILRTKQLIKTLKIQLN